MRVYGPYQRKDGRQHVIEIDDAGTRRTVSYPKWLVEQRLGRRLLDNETVDHIDCDFNNNEDSNLQVLDRSEHVKLDAKRARFGNAVCSWCAKEFTPSRNQAKCRKPEAGRFCSKQCSGQYGKHVQNGGVRCEPAQDIEPEYYTLKQEPNA